MRVLKTNAVSYSFYKDDREHPSRLYLSEDVDVDKLPLKIRNIIRNHDAVCRGLVEVELVSSEERQFKENGYVVIHPPAWFEKDTTLDFSQHRPASAGYGKVGETYK